MQKTTAEDKLTGYKAPAVHRAFELLRMVAQSHENLGLTELALQLGYSKSTTHGLVHALLREGALAQDPDGRKLYLGPAVVDLAFASWNYLKMVESVQAPIDELRNQIKETIVLGALICNRIMILAAAESTDPLKISASPGTVLPLFAGASGKVLLAGQSTAAVRQLIREKGLPQHTPRSITDEESYLDELRQVRDKGYSVDDQEYLTGVRAVAVALHNLKGPPMAIWAVGLSSKMGSDKIEETIFNMRAVAEDLCKALDKSFGY
jgi:DNA-binding IclR family transcriptional regulator